LSFELWRHFADRPVKRINFGFVPFSKVCVARERRNGCWGAKVQIKLLFLDAAMAAMTYKTFKIYDLCSSMNEDKLQRRQDAE